MRLASCQSLQTRRRTLTYSSAPLPQRMQDEEAVIGPCAGPCEPPCPLPGPSLSAAGLRHSPPLKREKVGKNVTPSPSLHETCSLTFPALFHPHPLLSLPQTSPFFRVLSPIEGASDFHSSAAAAAPVRGPSQNTTTSSIVSCISYTMFQESDWEHERTAESGGKEGERDWEWCFGSEDGRGGGRA
jgi:hypothetical protein